MSRGVKVVLACILLALSVLSTAALLKGPSRGEGNGRLGLPSPAPIAGNYTTTLSVRGSCSVSGAPDLVKVVLGVVVEAETSSEALREMSKRSKLLVEALKEMGVQEENMTTLTVELSPVYNYKVSPPQLVGYKATYRLAVKVSDPELAGEIIDKATEMGANEVSGISFVFSKEKREEMYLEALRGAVRDAWSKAEIVASAAGLRIIGVKEIRVEYGYYYPEREIPLPAPAKEAGVPVMTGESYVTATVYVVFTLAP